MEILINQKNGKLKFLILVMFSQSVINPICTVLRQLLTAIVDIKVLYLLILSYFEFHYFMEYKLQYCN